MKQSFTFSLVFTALVLLVMACSDNGAGGKSTSDGSTKGSTANPSSYDPNRGEGKYDASNVIIGPLDQAMAEKGKAISATKCNSCHKYSDERLVGPGWKGVTERRTPYWIMNFITNPDPMIEKDPEVQAQLELCLVRMPNQNLQDDEARNILEFMRQNDGAN